MNRSAELISTIAAGLVGALLAVTALGANLVLALPGALAVAVIAGLSTARRGS